LKPEDNDYEGSLPAVEDVLLLIEIADTTINYDRQIKAPFYALFCIPEYWLIDIQKPVQGQYTIVNTQTLSRKIAPLLLANKRLELR